MRKAVSKGVRRVGVVRPAAGTCLLEVRLLQEEQGEKAEDEGGTRLRRSVRPHRLYDRRYGNDCRCVLGFAGVRKRLACRFTSHSLGARCSRCPCALLR